MDIAKSARGAWTAASLSRELGTSVPRIARAADRLGISARGKNGRFAFTSSQAERIHRFLGVAAQAEGLTRTETLTLAALRSAPFGLVSVRAVARRSGLSPTAASRALRSLLAEGLVTHGSEVIAAGRAREVQVWRANILHPRWTQLDPILSRVVPPQSPERRPAHVPARLRHLFWNTAESQLDTGSAGPYIAGRLLRTMDLQGLAWGARALSPEDWCAGAEARGLDPAVRRLARNLAQSG